MAVSNNKLSELLFISSPIQPEEDITGFQCRTLDYRVTNNRKHLLRLLNDTSERLAWAFPTKLQRAVQHLTPLLPAFREVLQGHTRFPLFAPFLSKTERHELYCHHRGNGKSGGAQLAGTANSMLRVRLGMCMECVKSDLETLGFTFWRRAHLIPGVSFCSDHEAPLLTFCRSCELGNRRHNRRLSPSFECLCGKTLRVLRDFKSSQAEDSLMKVDRMANQLLKGQARVLLTDCELPTLTRGRLTREGLEGRFGVVGTLTEVLQERLGTEALNMLCIGKETVARLAGRDSENGFVKNPLTNIAVAYAVFGGWGAVNEEFKLLKSDRASYERAAIRRPQRERSDFKHLPLAVRIKFYQGLGEKEFEEHKAAARACILSALEDNPNLRRGQLRCYPSGNIHYGFALHMDTAWLDKELPARPAPSFIKVNTREWAESRGRELVRHIHAQRRCLTRDHPDKRIRRANLLNGSPCESKPGYAEQFDGVKEALAKCIDTDDTYDQRRMRRLVKVIRACNIKTHYTDYARWRGLTRPQFISQYNGAKKWLKKHAK
ncbi:hypothetical protein AWB64_04603 [Caballeronia sordidicola]|uniref:TniQ domain-containing protein n=1 Tax=Caballeronia sordidicola TaxID=196367 RepID=A0A158HG71_CABSO|nr:TniQ family protein [Caballeronia sordidicola]SAL43378.1 hypothetical protein AWB64_04603 [Caballeronia sordidicola]